MDLRVSFALSLVVLAVTLISFGEGLQCHQCTSYEHSKCGDPFWNEPENEKGVRTLKTKDFLKDCPNDGKNYTLCRKIYQNVRDDVRIIRSCGYEEYKNECYKTVLEEYSTLSCTCKEDGCNGSTNLKISVISVLSASLVYALVN